MALVAALGMALLLVTTLIVFKTWFSPAVLYCASWTSVLTLLAILGPMFYGIHEGSALLFLGAAVVFVFGCACGQGFRWPTLPARTPEGWHNRRLGLVLDLILVAVLAATPLALGEYRNARRLPELVSLLQTARLAAVESSGQVNAFSLLRNLPVFASVCTMMAVYLYDESVRSRCRIAIGTCLWFVLSITDGSKLVALQLPFLLLCAMAIRNRRVPWVRGGVAAAVSCVLFPIGLQLTNYGHLTAHGTTVPIAYVLTDMASYVVGGVVGLDLLLEGPTAMNSVHSPLRVPLSLINGIARTAGWSPPFDIGFLHAPIVTLGSQADGNVFTALYAYYGAGGWIGMFAWSAAAGVISGWLFRQLCFGRGWSFFVYPWVVFGAVMSVYSDQLFFAVSVATKWVLFSSLIVAVGRSTGFRRSLSPKEQPHYRRG